MGYEIEYGKYAFHHPHRNNQDEKDYFCFVKIASNNVIPRTPTPYYIGHGGDWQIIGKACKIASDVESGMWKPHNQWIKAEEYITSWRRALGRAKPFDTFLKKYFLRQFRITMLKEKYDLFQKTSNKEDFNDNRIKELMGLGKRTEESFCLDNIVVFTFPIDSYEVIDKAVSLYGLLKEKKLLYFWALDLN